jgi:hypothetical protein
MRARISILALSAALLGAGSAHAARDVAYSVSVEAAGSFRYASFEGDSEYFSAEEVDLEFAYEGALGEEVVFRNGHVFEAWGSDLPTITVAGAWTRRSPSGTVTCADIDEQAAHGWMRIAGRFDRGEDVVPLDGQEHLHLRPFDEFEPSWDCPDDMNFSWSLATAERNPFDILFELPPEAVGMGYVEQLIPPQVFEGEERCPTGGRTGVTECRLEWSGKVVFRKLWEKATTPFVSASGARLSPRAERVSFELTCVAACSGTATFRIPGGKAARARFEAPAGAMRVISVELGAKARRAARRGRTGKLVVRATADGRSSSRTFTLRKR